MSRTRSRAAKIEGRLWIVFGIDGASHAKCGSPSKAEGPWKVRNTTSEVHHIKDEFVDAWGELAFSSFNLSRMPGRSR